MVFSGAALPATYCILEVGLLGPAGGATERAELGYGAPGAVYASTAGVDVLVDVTQHLRSGWDRLQRPRSLPVHHTPIRPSRWPRQQAREGQLRGYSTEPEVRLQKKPL